MTRSTERPAPLSFRHRHLLGIDGLTRDEISGLLDLSESYIDRMRQKEKGSLLLGRTVMNLFFENSTRTRTSFELAAKRLGLNRTRSRLRTDLFRPPAQVNEQLSLF